MIDKRKAVFIEFCVNCSNHSWCTKHDEARYRNFYDIIKEKIEEDFNNITVYGNTSPITGREYSPTLGAFEIIFQDRVIFSKLRSRIWPSADTIAYRVKMIRENRDFNDFDIEDGDDGQESAKYKKGRNDRSANKSVGPSSRYHQDHSRQYFHQAGDIKVVYKNASREQHSLIDYDDESRDEFHALPKIHSNKKKRDNTPARLEHTGYTDKYMGNMKLAYLDPERKIFRLVRDNHQSHPQKKFLKDYNENDEQSLIYDDPSNSKDMISSPVHTTSNRRIAQGSQTDFANDVAKEVLPSMTGSKSQKQGNPKSPSSVHKESTREISRDRRSQPRIDQEESEATMFSSKSKKVDDSIREHRAQARKNELLHRGRPTTDDSGQVDNLSQLNPMLSKDQSLVDTHGRGMDETGMNYRSSSQRRSIDVRGKLDLRKVIFPEQKVSQIQAWKDRPLKKKITMVADSNVECKIGIYSNFPEVITMESNEMVVPKGEKFKVSLKFEYSQDEESQDCYLFLLKDNRPWQKILVEVTYH